MKPIKKDIRALTKEQLRDFFVENGDKAFRAKQVHEWLWKKSARNFGSVLIGIETSSPENFDTVYARLDAAGFTYRDITSDETLAECLI